MTKHWDLIVIGAGIIGVTTAWMAQNKFYKKVLIIEKKIANQGATSYALALRTPYYESAAMQALVVKSNKIYAEEIDILDECAPTRVPSFWIVQEGTEEKLRCRLACDQLQLVSCAKQKKLLRCLPGLQISRNERLAYDPDDKIGSPVKTSETLLREFVNDGGTIVEGVQFVTCLECSQGVKVVLSDDTFLTGTYVVIATGPWMAREFSSYLLPPVRCKKIVAFHIQEAPSKGASSTQWLDEDVFLSPDFYRNRYWLSVRSNEWNVLPDDSKISISQAEVDFAQRFLSRYFPRLLNKIKGGRVFCDGYSKTSSPYISRDPFTKGVYYAGAAGGAGYRLAPAIAYDVLMLLGTRSLIPNG